MTSIGTGYDLSCTSYSPDGRVFQLEYAAKAVENSGTAIGLRVKDGVVLGVEKLIISKMLVEGSNKRIATVDKHTGLTFAGFAADARQLVNRARQESREYKGFYGDLIPGHVLASRLSNYVQMHTLYSSIRPFGCSVILSAWGKDGPQLYMIEPSGVSYGYFGTAVGKGKQAAKGEIEKLKLAEMTCREAVNAIAKIIYQIHDEAKDKDFELELSWICEESGRQHQAVPKEIVDEADRLAKAALDEEMIDAD
eukprot:TRINITY_DN9984_c0_g1_i1.p1 TRINITY_DN9984_c0_g1~~TRINITY_DN9984_c0_g1_i1.p1  ORF type:complete len:252 (+),score=51.20 TRINITY_DN9984_c0_g1_i1:74-829(+)